VVEIQPQNHHAEQADGGSPVSAKCAMIEGPCLDGEKKPLPNAEFMRAGRPTRAAKALMPFYKKPRQTSRPFSSCWLTPQRVVAFALRDPQGHPSWKIHFLKQNSSQVPTVKAEAGAKTKAWNFMFSRWGRGGGCFGRLRWSGAGVQLLDVSSPTTKPVSQQTNKISAVMIL